MILSVNGPHDTSSWSMLSSVSSNGTLLTEFREGVMSFVESTEFLRELYPSKGMRERSSSAQTSR